MRPNIEARVLYTQSQEYDLFVSRVRVTEKRGRYSIPTNCTGCPLFSESGTYARNHVSLTCGSFQESSVSINGTQTHRSAKMTVKIVEESQRDAFTATRNVLSNLSSTTNCHFSLR